MNSLDSFGNKKLKGKKLDKEIDFLALSTDDSKGNPINTQKSIPKKD